MRRLLTAVFVLLSVAVAGCTSSGESAGSSSSASGAPVLEVPSNVGSSPASLGSATATTAESSAPPDTSAPDTSVPATVGPQAIELPPISGLPVRTLPLPPGATATRDTAQPEESPSQSYTVTLTGSTGAELAAWYRTALAEAGFGVGEAGADGGFSWQGTGVTGTGAVADNAFVLSVGPAG